MIMMGLLTNHMTLLSNRADYCNQIYYHDRLSIVDFTIAIVSIVYILYIFNQLI